MRRKRKVAIHCVFRANFSFCHFLHRLWRSPSHYLCASYLHKNCISVAGRGSAAVPLRGPGAYSDHPPNAIFNVRQILKREWSKGKQGRVKDERNGMGWEQRHKVWHLVKRYAIWWCVGVTQWTDPPPACQCRLQACKVQNSVANCNHLSFIRVLKLFTSLGLREPVGMELRHWLVRVAALTQQFCEWHIYSSQ